MLHLYAVPLEFRPHHQKYFSPFHRHLFHAREDCFFIDKLYGKLAHVDLASSGQIYKEPCDTKAVLSTAKRKENRQSIAKHVPDPYLCSLHDVNASLFSLYSHIFSPHFGQITNFLIFAGSSPSGSSADLNGIFSVLITAFPATGAPKAV